MKELLKKREGMGRQETMRRQSRQDTKKEWKSPVKRGEKYDYAAPELQ